MSTFYQRAGNPDEDEKLIWMRNNNPDSTVLESTYTGTGIKSGYNE